MRSERAVDHIEITRLQSTYADVVNRRAWTEFDDLFLDDTVVRIDTVTRPVFELVGPAALADFIGGAVERFAFFEFVVLNSRIEFGVDADGAAARIFMCEVRRDLDTLDWSIAYGVYHDRYRRFAGGWRFVRRDYQSLTRTDSEVFPFPSHLSID